MSYLIFYKGDGIIVKKHYINKIYNIKKYGKYIFVKLEIDNGKKETLGFNNEREWEVVQKNGYFLR